MTSSHPYWVAFFILYGEKTKIYSASVSCLDWFFRAGKNYFFAVSSFTNKPAFSQNYFARIRLWV